MPASEHEAVRRAIEHGVTMTRAWQRWIRGTKDFPAALYTVDKAKLPAAIKAFAKRAALASEYDEYGGAEGVCISTFTLGRRRYYVVAIDIEDRRGDATVMKRDGAVVVTYAYESKSVYFEPSPAELDAERALAGALQRALSADAIRDGALAPGGDLVPSHLVTTPLFRYPKRAVVYRFSLDATPLLVVVVPTTYEHFDHARLYAHVGIHRPDGKRLATGAVPRAGHDIEFRVD